MAVKAEAQEKILGTITEIHQAAVEVFGEDRVDIQARATNDKGANLVIHFPELTVTNSNKNVHIVRDLYMMFTIRISDISKVGKGEYAASVHILGNRSTFTPDEYHAHYTHSHMGASERLGWSNWCTGGGTPISMQLATIGMNMSETSWQLLFYSLEGYLSWESLEGVPYRKIAEIGSRTPNVSDQDITEELYRILPLMPKEVWNYSKSLSLTVSHPSVYEFFNEHSKIRGKKMGSLHEAQKLQGSVVGRYHSGLTFKNKILDLKIVPESGTMDDTIDKSIVNRYVDILKRRSLTFNKKYKYAQLKESCEYPEVAKIGAFQ